MSKANDFIALVNENHRIELTMLKKLFRLTTDDDVVIKFVDGSEVKFQRTDSWRTDRLYVENQK